MGHGYPEPPIQLEPINRTRQPTRTLNPIQLSRNPPIQLAPLTETSEPKGMSWCWQAHSSAEPIQGNATDREAIPPSHNASRSTRSPSGWGTVIPTHRSNWSHSTGQRNQPGRPRGSNWRRRDWGIGRHKECLGVGRTICPLNQKERSVRRRMARTSSQSRSDQHDTAEPIQGNATDRESSPPSNTALRSTKVPVVGVDGARLSQPTTPTGATNGGR